MSSEGAGERPADPPLPARTGTPAEFTAALRALRTWSGLTYRQLEGKAAAHRDTLPASTIATTLGRATLPRERFVDAFTRACGLGEDDVREWLEARRRIAMADPSADPAPSDEPPAHGLGGAGWCRWPSRPSPGWSSASAAPWGSARCPGRTPVRRRGRTCRPCR